MKLPYQLCDTVLSQEENAALVNLFRVDAIPHFAMVDTDTKLLTTLTG